MPGADISAVENAVVEQYQAMGAMDWLPSMAVRMRGREPRLVTPEQYGSIVYNDLKRQVAEFGLDKRASPPSSREAYLNLAGEAEARNVQTRANFTEQMRRETPPWATYDVPLSSLIVRR